MRSIGNLAAFVLFVLGTSQAARAYEQETHREIARQATGSRDPSRSTVDAVLKSELGLSEGIQREFGRPLSTPAESPSSVIDLVGKGAFAEDVPFRRSLNHFHNPLRIPWSGAGLDSSVLRG